MKTYWGSGGTAPRILNLDSTWRWVVSFAPRPLYTQGKKTGTHWIGGCVGPEADAEAKRKNPIIAPAGNWTLVVKPVAPNLFIDW